MITIDRSVRKDAEFQPHELSNEAGLDFQEAPTTPGRSVTVYARDIMTAPVVTVPETMTLGQAAALLSRENISGAPVTDETGRVVGVVSEKDLLVHAQSYASLPRLTVGPGALPYSGGLGDVPASLLGDAYAAGLSAGVPEVMSYPVVSAREDDTTTHLADLMLTHRLNRVPILTAEGKAVGIVTREDVLRAIVLMAASPFRCDALAAPQT